MNLPVSAGREGKARELLPLPWININAQYSNGNTPLILAVQGENGPIRLGRNVNGGREVLPCWSNGLFIPAASRRVIGWGGALASAGNGGAFRPTDAADFALDGSNPTPNLAPAYSLSPHFAFCGNSFRVKWKWAFPGLAKRQSTFPTEP